jgi:hypothetical protein
MSVIIITFFGVTLGFFYSRLLICEIMSVMKIVLVAEIVVESVGLQK